MAAVGRAELHGQKRQADGELEGEQPLTKKFGRLHIAKNGSKPIATSTIHAPPAPPTARNTSKTDEDGMQIDDTKTKVYINDLEREIAEIEAEEQRHFVEFSHPEVEKQVMAIPQSVLNQKPDNQLVLYRLPRALSISEEDDRIRPAVAGARERAQEKSIADAKRIESEDMELEINRRGVPTTSLGANSGSEAREMAVDGFEPMEIDD